MVVSQKIEEKKENTQNSNSNLIPNQKLHYIAVTCIIRNDDGKYLICKRSPNEKAFPNKWCVPGGKVETDNYVNTQKDTKDHWFDILEKTVKKEVLEETNLQIKNIGYVSNLCFIRPNGYPTLIISLYGELDLGEVKLNEEELIDFAWVEINELKNYDLIENIAEQIICVDDKFEE